MKFPNGSRITSHRIGWPRRGHLTDNALFIDASSHDLLDRRFQIDSGHKLGSPAVRPSGWKHLLKVDFGLTGVGHQNSIRDCVSRCRGPVGGNAPL